MKWFEEITNAVLSDFKKFSVTTSKKYCVPGRVKLNKEKLEKLVMSAQCRGSVSIVDELLKLSKKEEHIDRAFLEGTLHIMRMNLWNEAAFHSDGMLKIIGLETAMQIDPDINDLVNLQKVKEVHNA